MAITSHDLKAPVAGMMSYANLIREHLAHEHPEKAPPLVDRIVELGGGMLGLIGDLLNLEKIESGTFQLDVRPCRLDEVLHRSVETHAVVARARGVELSLEVLGKPRLLFVDPDRLDQVFSNLLSNALKFSPEGGKVEVSFSDDGEQARVTVSDRGPGIAPDELPRVFDRYHQAKGQAGSVRNFGVGLGLAIAKHLVELHAGRIVAENRDGGGGRFFLELPVKGVRVQAPGSAAMLLGPLPSLRPQLETLLRHQAYRLVSVSDAEEARRAVHADPPSVVFVEPAHLPEELGGCLTIK